jgi:L-lactate utilization protein LutC
VPANWHYFQLLHDATKPQTEASAARSTRAAAGLSDPAHRWLGNVPVADLVELRKRLENERFRERLSKYMSQVANADSSSMAQAATEVERGLAALVAEHQNDLRRIAEEYAQKHVGTAVSSWFTFVASFSILFPATAAAGLVPPSAAMALAAKYVSDKGAERTKRAQLGSSLLGCLAAAARKA